MAPEPGQRGGLQRERRHGCGVGVEQRGKTDRHGDRAAQDERDAVPVEQVRSTELHERRDGEGDGERQQPARHTTVEVGGGAHDAVGGRVRRGWRPRGRSNPTPCPGGRCSARRASRRPAGWRRAARARRARARRTRGRRGTARRVRWAMTRGAGQSRSMLHAMATAETPSTQSSVGPNGGSSRPFATSQATCPPRTTALVTHADGTARASTMPLTATTASATRAGSVPISSRNNVLANVASSASTPPVQSACAQGMRCARRRQPNPTRRQRRTDRADELHERADPAAADGGGDRERHGEHDEPDTTPLEGRLARDGERGHAGARRGRSERGWRRWRRRRPQPRAGRWRRRDRRGSPARRRTAGAPPRATARDRLRAGRPAPAARRARASSHRHLQAWPWTHRRRRMCDAPGS